MPKMIQCGTCGGTYREAETGGCPLHSAAKDLYRLVKDAHDAGAFSGDQRARAVVLLAELEEQGGVT